MNNLQTKYKILTWNVLWKYDYEQRIFNIAAFIKQIGANIVLLQETNDQFAAQTIEAFSQNGYVIRLQPGNPITGDASGIGVSYDPHYFIEINTDQHIDEAFQAMSIDLLPTNKAPLVKRPVKYIGNQDNHQYESPLDYGTDVLTVISYHGHWGVFAQAKRLEQIHSIDNFARAKGNAVILGGDFNALPDEPAIQYLHGNLLIDSQSTYWVEAQDLVQQLGGPTPYGTSFTHGPIIDSHQRFNLHRTPERRIDFLFNYGFSYGREYAFDGWSHSLDINQARSLSDHAPIVAGLLDS